VQSLVENLKSLGQGRLIALGVTGVALVAALFFGLTSVMKPGYATLYRDLNPSEANRIVNVLEGGGFRVEITGGGSIVSVPQEDLARARMELAGQGLPGDGTPGWELFDEGSGLGMNSFMQRVNRLRALEGELARSIQTLDGVDAARVHLVLPEREAFSREKPQPSASVIVRGRAGHTVSNRQALSIRALVASAVPDMAPARVTVLSASGETILGEDVDAGAESTIQTVRAGIEDRIASNITEILTARVGAGNARVKVSVDLTTERQVIRAHSFDPAQRVVRSTETSEETREEKNTSSGEVGVLDDIPEELAGTGNTGNRNSVARTDEVVNYEIGSTQSETVKEPGEIERVSVAVLVNGIYNVANNGDVQYEERSPEELDRLNQLVQAAIGFDAERGDSVSVDSLRFMDYSMDVGEPVGRSMGQVLADNLMSILRGVFALAVVAVVLKMGVLPMVNRIFAEREQPNPESAALPEGETPPALPQTEDANAPQIAGPESNVTPMPSAGFARSGTVLDPVAMGGNPQELVTFAAVDGGVQKGWINTVGEIIENQPEDSLKVLKTWLAEGA
jgi:flagellar M-ring protein FliF